MFQTHAEILRVRVPQTAGDGGVWSERGCVCSCVNVRIRLLPCVHFCSHLFVWVSFCVRAGLHTSALPSLWCFQCSHHACGCCPMCGYVGVLTFDRLWCLEHHGTPLCACFGEWHDPACMQTLVSLCFHICSFPCLCFLLWVFCSHWGIDHEGKTQSHSIPLLYTHYFVPHHSIVLV